MDNKIKTEDIIKTLRLCAEIGFSACEGCAFEKATLCSSQMQLEAANRLEMLNDQLIESAKMADNTECAIMCRAIDTYGRQAQTDVAIEEMSELTKALLKTRRVPNDDHDAQLWAVSNVVEEIADVSIMIDQLKIMYGERYVNAVREQKLVRLEGRLNDAETKTNQP